MQNDADLNSGARIACRRGHMRANAYAAAAILALGVFGLMATPAPAEQPSVLVKITKLHKGSLPHTVAAFGAAQADPSARRAVMAPVSATVAKIFVRLGEAVKRGSPLIRLLPNPQTSAEYAKARSTLQVANGQMKHTRELFSQYLATNQQLADAKKAQSDARAALQALQAQGAGGAKTLAAPFPAIVTKLDTSTGSLVSEGAALLELALPDSLVLRVGIVPSEAAGIKTGDKVTVTPVGSARTFDARVLLRGSVVDPSDGLVPVEISLPPNSLLPGETAQAEIETHAVKGFVVPHGAVLINDKGQPYVVQIVNETAKLVIVRTLYADGDRDVIAGKLDPSAPLVLSGNYQLRNGMKARLHNAGAPGR